MRCLPTGTRIFILTYIIMEKEKPKFKFDRRATAFADLKEFCHLAGPADYIEVTMWSNYEGYDIHISDKIGTRSLSMTDGELTAVKKLVKFLNKELDAEFNND